MRLYGVERLTYEMQTSYILNEDGAVHLFNSRDLAEAVAREMETDAGGWAAFRVVPLDIDLDLSARKIEGAGGI